MPACSASWISTPPTPPLAPNTRIVCPAETLAARCSICHAVTPLTVTASTRSGSSPSGTTTLSRASTTACPVQAPVLVMVATRAPTRSAAVLSPVAMTLPTRS